MNTGSAADLLKCTYTYGKARKSTFPAVLLALIGTLAEPQWFKWQKND